MEESLCDSSSERFALGDLRRSTNTKGTPFRGCLLCFCPCGAEKFYGNLVLTIQFAGFLTFPPLFLKARANDLQAAARARARVRGALPHHPRYP